MSAGEADIATGDDMRKGKGFLSEGSSLFPSTTEGRVICDFRVTRSGSVCPCGSAHRSVRDLVPFCDFAGHGIWFVPDGWECE